MRIQINDDIGKELCRMAIHADIAATFSTALRILLDNNSEYVKLARERYTEHLLGLVDEFKRTQAGICDGCGELYVMGNGEDCQECGYDHVLGIDHNE